MRAKPKGLLEELTKVNFLDKVCFLTIIHTHDKFFRLVLTDESR